MSRKWSTVGRIALRYVNKRPRPILHEPLVVRVRELWYQKCLKHAAVTPPPRFSSISPPLGLEARPRGGGRACQFSDGRLFPLRLYQHFYMIPHKHARPQGASIKPCKSILQKRSTIKKKKKLFKWGSPIIAYICNTCKSTFYLFTKCFHVHLISHLIWRIVAVGESDCARAK